MTTFWTRIAKRNEPAKPRHLRALVIDEVSLVDKGANPHAMVTLCKRQDGASVPTKKDNEMSSDPGVELVKLAKQINTGEMKSHRSKAEWYRVTKALAEGQRQSGETSEQSFSRFVMSTDDGRELFKAMRSAGGPDWDPPAPQPALVAKSDGAYHKLQVIAKGIQTENPDLSEHQAFARAFTDPNNRELAEQAKREPAA